MMTAGLTVPLMGIAAFAMKSASDVGGAFKIIQKATGATGPQFDSLKGSFKDVFGKMPVDANEAASAIGKLSPILTNLNNGVAPTRESMTQVTTAFEQFAKVTGTDVTADVETLGKTFKAFGVSGDEIPGMLGEVNIAAQKTGDSTENLMSSVLAAAPTFNTMGFSMSETTAMMAQLDMSGAKGKATISALTKVMKEAGEAGKDPKKAFAELNTELKNGQHTSKEAQELYKELGAKGFANLSTAARSGALDINGLTKAMKEGSGGLDAQYKQTLSFGDNLKMLTNKLELAFQPLGTVIFKVLNMLLDKATPIINFVTMLSEKFADMSPNIQMVVVVLGGLLAALGPILLIVGKLMTSFTQIQKAVSTIGPMMGKLAAPAGKAVGAAEGLASKLPGLGALGGEGGGMASMLAPVMPLLTPILVAVAAIAAVFAVLYATSKTFRDVVGGILGKFQELFAWAGRFVGVLTSGNLGGAFDMLKKAIGDVGHMFATIDWGGVGRTIIKVFQESFATISGAVGPFIGTIGKALGGAFDSLKKIDWGGMFAGGLDAVAKFLDSLLNFDPGPMIDSLISAIGGAFDSLFGGGGKADVKGATTTGGKADLGGNLSKSVEKAGPDILGKLGNVFVKLVGLLPAIFVKVATALATALGKVDWGTVFNKIGVAIVAAVKGALGPALSGVGVALANALGGAGDFLSKLFGGAGAAISKFLGTLASSVGTYLGGFGQWIWNAVIAVFKLDVKLWTWLANTVKTYAGGFGQWIWNAIITAFNFDKKLFQAVITAFSTFGAKLWDLVKGLGDKIKTNVWDKLAGFGAWLIQQIATIGSRAWSWISGALGGFGNWLITQVTTIGSRIWGWISGAVGGFGNWLITQASSIGSRIWSWITGAVGSFGSWLGGLVSGIGSTIWSRISGAVGQFGSWLGGLVSGIGGSIWNSIVSAVSSFGSHLVDLIKNVTWDLSGIGTALTNAIKGAWNNTIGGHHSFLGISFDVPMIAKGGVIPATPGGRLFVAGEGNEMEVVVPGSRVGEEWSSLLSGPNALQHLAKGAVIGSNIPMSAPAAAPAAGSGMTSNPSYYATVIVDSEDMTRKVFKGFRDLEDYNLMRYR
jgi:TP901 family phage tail tape measure protein